MNTDYRRTLLHGLAQQELTLADDAIDRLLAYHGLLIKWNKAYNLTSVREPSAMIARHLLDSLSVLPYIQPASLLDVGSGPGLPGMVLALVQPEMPVTLLDSNGKKTRFLTQVTMQLNATNVNVVHSRLEQWQPGHGFAQITSRAFATLGEMVAKSAHLIEPGGRFLAMKGLYPHDEIAALPPAYALTAVHTLQVPGTDGARHLIELSAQPQ